MLSESEKKTPTDPTIFSTSDFLTVQNTGHNEKSHAHFRADSLEVSVLEVSFKCYVLLFQGKIIFKLSLSRKGGVGGASA